MTTNELAQDFTAMLKRGENREAAAKYNADDIVSFEPMDGPMAMIKGKEAVEKKGEWWYANHEIHSATAEGPYVNGDQFGVGFRHRRDRQGKRAAHADARDRCLQDQRRQDRRGEILFPPGMIPNDASLNLISNGAVLAEELLPLRLGAGEHCPIDIAAHARIKACGGILPE